MDNSQKKDLYDFRRSWKNLFSDKRLLDLDEALNRIDSGWPVTGSTNKNNVKPSSTKFVLIFAELCEKVSKSLLKNVKFKFIYLKQNLKEIINLKVILI